MICFGLSDVNLGSAEREREREREINNILSSAFQAEADEQTMRDETTTTPDVDVGRKLFSDLI